MFVTEYAYGSDVIGSTGTSLKFVFFVYEFVQNTHCIHAVDQLNVIMVVKLGTGILHFFNL